MWCFVTIVAIFVHSALSASLLNSGDRIRYENCDEILRSGRYKSSGDYLIFLNSSEPIQIYCSFELGQATIPIMQQKYGRTSFVRGWNDYEYGFGTTTSGDFWIGLHRIKQLTDTGYRILTITLQDWSRQIRRIQYNSFALGPAYDRYRLHIGGYQSSLVLPDDLSFNDNMQFATFDQPDPKGCALHQHAGWWYNYCSYVLPTGKYYGGGPYTPSGQFYDGIYYKDWHGYGYSLLYIKMELSHF